MDFLSFVFFILEAEFRDLVVLSIDTLRVSSFEQVQNKKVLQQCRATILAAWLLGHLAPAD